MQGSGYGDDCGPRSGLGSTQAENPNREPTRDPRSSTRPRVTLRRGIRVRVRVRVRREQWEDSACSQARKGCTDPGQAHGAISAEENGTAKALHAHSLGREPVVNDERTGSQPRRRPTMVRTASTVMSACAVVMVGPIGSEISFLRNTSSATGHSPTSCPWSRWILSR